MPLLPPAATAPLSILFSSPQAPSGQQCDRSARASPTPTDVETSDHCTGQHWESELSTRARSGGSREWYTHCATGKNNPTPSPPRAGLSHKERPSSTEQHWTHLIKLQPSLYAWEERRAELKVAPTLYRFAGGVEYRTVP